MDSILQWYDERVQNSELQSILLNDSSSELSILVQDSISTNEISADFSLQTDVVQIFKPVKTNTLSKTLQKQGEGIKFQTKNADILSGPGFQIGVRKDEGVHRITVIPVDEQEDDINDEVEEGYNPENGDENGEEDSKREKKLKI
nr:unnamed protein product [Callosobruchus analis]